MEEFKKGIISEEALDEIAGGLNISKGKVASIFKKIGIGVSAAASVLAAISATTVLANEGYKHFKKGKKEVQADGAPAEEHKGVENNG